MRGALRSTGNVRVAALANRDRHQSLQKRPGSRGRPQATAPNHHRCGSQSRARTHRRVDPPVQPLVGAKTDRERSLPGVDARNAGGRQAAAHLRHARARRHKRRRITHRPDESDVVFPPAPAGIVLFIAVLGGPQHGSQELSSDRVRRVATHRLAGEIRELRRVRAPHKHPYGRRAYRGRDAHLVGPQAECPLPDTGNTHHGRLYAARGHRVAGGHADLYPAHAVSAAIRESALATVHANAHL